MPTALRIPQAKTRRFLPSGSKARMSARSKLGRVIVGIVDVRVRADRHVQRLSVAREAEIARPVAAAPEEAAARQLSDRLGRATRLDVAAAIREANDRVGVADVEPLRVAHRRIEGEPERFVQPGGEPFGHHGASVRADAAKNPNFADGALGDEQVAVRRRADEARVGEPAGVELDPESRRRLRPGVAWTGHHLGPVVGRPGRMRRGQVAAR